MEIGREFENNTNELQFSVNQITSYIHQKDIKAAAKQIWNSADIALSEFALRYRIELKSFRAKTELYRCLLYILADNDRNVPAAADFSSTWADIIRSKLSKYLQKPAIYL